MKLKSGYIKMIVPAAVLLVAAGAFAAIPSLRERFSKKEPVAARRIVITENNEQDKKVLSELSGVLHAMDTVTVITVNGFMDGVDLADSTSNMQSAFCYSRQGNQGYYQLGSNEMISLTDAYIVVANDVKKIFVSRPKEVINPIRMPIKTEVDFLAHESYKVSRRAEGALTRISLTNPTHASYREYTISFDTLNIVRKSVMRMTDPEALTDPTKDKILTISISNWEVGAARKDLLRMDRYISRVNGEMVPAARLKGYEIVKD